MSRARAELHQYVGVKEICEKADISRSTLDRLRRDGDFPAPTRLSPNRVVWRLDTVQKWMDTRNSAQKQALATAAVTDPSKLSDDKLQEAAFAAAAEHLSRISGKDVRPKSVVMLSVRSATADEEAERAKSIEDGVRHKVVHWPLERALISAFHMFPAIREWLAKRPDVVQGVPADADAAFEMLKRIIGEDGWRVYQSEASSEDAPDGDASEKLEPQSG